MERKYRKNILLYYFNSFFSSLVFQRGIFILFLLEKNISNTQIGTLQSTLFFTNFLMEIPCGIFGDKFGRKYSLIAGIILAIINGIGMLIFSEYLPFLILFVINGLQMAFTTGSDIALLYDSLKIIKQEDSFTKINSRMYMISSVTIGVAIYLGGLLQKISWNYVYGAYTIAMILTLIAIIPMYENINMKEEPTTRNTFKDIVKFWRYKNGKLLLIFIMGCGLFEGIMTPFFIHGQTLFHDFKLSPEKIGIIFSLIQFLSGFIVLLANAISKKFKFTTCTYLTLFVTSVLLLSFYRLDNLILILITFFFLTIFPEIFYILRTSYFQKRISSSVRATIGSVNSFIQSIFISIMYIIYGLLIDSIGIRAAIALSSIGIIVSALSFYLYFLYSKKYENSKFLEVN